jgi:hypothetical protein
MNRNIIPQFYSTHSKLFSKILEKVESEPNNMTLGESVREIISDYKEGKFNSPSTNEFEKDER